MNAFVGGHRGGLLGSDLAQVHHALGGAPPPSSIGEYINLAAIVVTIMLAVVPRSKLPGLAWVALMVILNGAAMITMGPDDPRFNLAPYNSIAHIIAFWVARIATSRLRRSKRP